VIVQFGALRFNRVPEGGDFHVDEAVDLLISGLTDAVPFKLAYLTELEMQRWPKQCGIVGQILTRQ